LLQAERALTSSDGLIGRPWYKHLIYAPGFYTGYGVKTMPGIRESIEQHQWKDVDREIERVAAALTREATLVSGPDRRAQHRLTEGRVNESLTVAVQVT
jgi:N-acetylated-alpha-linked acidic dipeptidase